MVDAAAAIEPPDGDGPWPAPAKIGNLTATVRHGPAALDLYAALCASCVAAPAQSAAWIRNWSASTAPDLVLIFLEGAGHPVFALALEVVRSGPFRIARFPGGPHANGNFPAASLVLLAGNSPDHILALIAGIRQARPDIDLLALERQTGTLGGFWNPLLALPHRASPNLALAVDLHSGFDALLERASGKRKRKKHRSQIRKFEAAGGYRRFAAATPAEVEFLLSAFLEMKGQRFRRQGIVDTFADPGVQTFLRRLFTSALADERPHFILHGLEVGGKLRAVTGSSLCDDRLVCEFSAFAEDDLVSASPGDFLFFENIREACEEGFAIYDFSVGDEVYKRQWCDIETTQFDVIVPLTAKGRLLASATNASSTAKRIIKNNSVLWAVAKRMRKSARAQTAEGEA